MYICYDCGKELDEADVELEFVYHHDRYPGKHRALCDYCKLQKDVTIDDQALRDIPEFTCDDVEYTCHEG